MYYICGREQKDGSIMIRLCWREEEQISLLIDGINEYHLRRQLLDNRFSTVAEFVDHVRNITEDSTLSRFSNVYGNNGSHNRPPGGRSSAYAAPQASGPPNNVRVCFIRKGPGHIARECRKSVIRCYKCNGMGHVSRECKVKINDSVQNVRGTSSSQGRSNDTVAGGIE